MDCTVLVLPSSCKVDFEGLKIPHLIGTELILVLWEESIVLRILCTF